MAEIEYDDWEVKVLLDGEWVETHTFGTYVEVSEFTDFMKFTHGEDREHRWVIQVYSGEDVLFQTTIP